MNRPSALSALACAVALAAAAALAACSSAPIDSIDGSPPSVANALLTSIGFTITSGARPLGGDGVMDYEVRNPLFSDHALKSRVIKLPRGTSMRYLPDGTIEVPLGAVVAKSFGYPSASATGGVTWIETRVLVHEAEGWKGYEFVWNERQTDAVRKPQGTSMELRDVHGLAPSSYALPNESDCGDCHGRERSAPIALRADQLDRDEQLARWTASGVMRDVPSASEIPHAPAWNDPTSGSVADRARAYLDANCAHCHREGGSAKGTGLFLGRTITDAAKLGTCKTTTVDGKTSRDVVPGKPEESLLVHRMRATDEAMRMPPIGRTMVHDDAVSLVESWIRVLPGTCTSE